MKTAVFWGRVRVLKWSETGKWIYFYSFINFFSIKGSTTLSSAVCYQGQIITGGEKATPRALRRKASLKWTIILIEQEAQYLGKCTSCRNRLHCVLHYASTDRKKMIMIIFSSRRGRTGRSFQLQEQLLCFSLECALGPKPLVAPGRSHSHAASQSLGLDLLTHHPRVGSSYWKTLGHIPTLQVNRLSAQSQSSVGQGWVFYKNPGSLQVADLEGISETNSALWKLAIDGHSF